ncbi:MAG: SpoIIE family protein phosphatase [Candidatus Zixiibacteriota bacterium]
MSEKTNFMTQGGEATLLKNIFESLADGVIVADSEGDFLLFNPSAESILGIGTRNIGPGDWPSVYGCYQKDKKTLYPPDLLPLARAIKGERVHDEPIYIKNNDKLDGIWISVSGQPLADEGGEIWGGLVFFRDITEKMNIKESMNSNFQQFTALLENQKAATLVENNKSQIQSVNSAFCELFDIPGDPWDLINTNCTQFVEKIKNIFSDPDKFINRIEELRESCSIVTNERLLLKNGRLLERDYIPVITGDECYGHLWQYWDVTDREIIQDKIHLFERLSQALEQTADSVVITGRNGIIEYVNRAFETTTGYTSSEACGQTPQILKSGKQDGKFYKELWDTITSGETFKGTLVNLKKTGELYWAEQTITPIKNNHGKITHFVSVLKDITELLKKKEQEVEMRLARQVQQRYYKAGASVPGYDIAGAAFPADATGGDYFDFINMPNNRLGIAIGDVSGHGISSAIVMAETRALIRAFASNNSDVGSIMTQVKRVLEPDLDEGRFVTLLLICLDPQNQTITYANAGHEYGYILSETGKPEYIINSTGPPLGMLPKRKYSSHKTPPLKPGQTILLLTDGVTDSRSSDDKEFESDGAIACVKDNYYLPAAQIAKNLCLASKSFAKDQILQDDVTSIIIKTL